MFACVALSCSIFSVLHRQKTFSLIGLIVICSKMFRNEILYFFSRFYKDFQQYFSIKLEMSKMYNSYKKAQLPQSILVNILKTLMFVASDLIRPKLNSKGDYVSHSVRVDAYKSSDSSNFLKNAPKDVADMSFQVLKVRDYLFF